MNLGGFSGFVLDPAHCSRLSMGEKRELIREIAQWSKDAPEILSSFTRMELLELSVPRWKCKTGNTNDTIASSPAKTRTRFKRKRKKESQLQLSTDLNLVSQESDEEVKIRVYQNVAWRAILSPDDDCCKRCSCHICHYYDDNKDLTLWLTCGLDSPGENSCGLACHLICALKDERTGIMKTGCQAKLDGSFYCVSCGKINGLLRQVLLHMVACSKNDASRLTIAFGSSKQNLRILLTSVVIVLEYADDLSDDFLCCILWHRESKAKDSPHKPTSIILKPEKRYKISDLTPSTEYFCKASFFGSKGIMSVWEAKWITPTSNGHSVTALGEYREEEKPMITQIESQLKSTNSRNIKVTSMGTRRKDYAHCLHPWRLFHQQALDHFLRKHLLNPVECDKCQVLVYIKQESAYEYPVRVVKWLKLEGHIEEDFRVKFLTWFQSESNNSREKGG
ncbi:hypothetical protein GH714_003458 [Hevea brasiliensis]|uniref:Uncharacterized protein n=1 Tax=Hevea brasiliensis TaxID=3981 RepID=A0A6A6LIF6_HEVBR|nr:hypothetical protein GH714_003458 [Hevea brasiliensis]